MNFSIKALTIVALLSVIASATLVGLNQYHNYEKSAGLSSYNDDEFVSWVRQKNLQAEKDKQYLLKAQD